MIALAEECGRRRDPSYALPSTGQELATHGEAFLCCITQRGFLWCLVQVYLHFGFSVLRREGPGRRRILESSDLCCFHCPYLC
ncbi:hypothetical protein L228DRAFT_86259 [Xylona heveae TC161]|uniref:Uncharacterized protein n=1 Tax=Xylona heveae (strain CBS 132557 / TC161) TaxID=1328760 RepID=A0A161TDN5_XYLHT|nr:hypothetical protein L228DRAFT_86259 [Xylona heveae TC161]KZF23987.1 hypothetical protein L228DRAFT_86259 [Xylona heveae TC161]